MWKELKSFCSLHSILLMMFNFFAVLLCSERPLLCPPKRAIWEHWDETGNFNISWRVFLRFPTALECTVCKKNWSLLFLVFDFVFRHFNCMKSTFSLEKHTKCKQELLEIKKRNKGRSSADIHGSFVQKGIVAIGRLYWLAFPLR